MTPVRAMILAAGEGARMKSERPKVLHLLCGRPMVAYAVNLAAWAGVKQPIVVLGPHRDAVQAVLPGEAKTVIQPKPTGTAEAVLAAKKALGGLAGDVLILYADIPLLRRTTIQHLVESHHKNNATCTLLSTHLADPSGYGRILREPTGQIIGIVEEAEASTTQRAIREINVGPLICKTHALMEALTEVKPSGPKKERYLTHAVGLMARQEGAKIHSIRVEETSEALGINTRAELAKAIGIIRQRIIDLHLRNGVTIEDPQTTWIEQGVTIGPDTVIRPHTVIESGVSIGKRCTIGPFARLRTGVTLADDIRIGNFAELVRTKVGPRVRISHVSYLGDATVEEEVNIGAGTITANYDGKARHPTRIGKGAFIGCDTVLIAPVNVGPGAITGAGSVVTRAHDVPPKGVVVGVPARAMTPSAEKDGAVHVRPAKPSRPTPSARRKAPVRSTRSPKRPSLKGHHAARATRRHERARR